MDFSHDSMDDWHSWADLCQWTPDWTYYAHNSATPTSGAFEAFEGGWSSDMGRTTGAIEPRNTDDGGQVWQEAHVRVQEGSFSTSTYQASLQRESSITSHTTVTEAFPDLSTTYKTDPAPLCGLEVHRQKPRFAGDLYTALWVRGEGTERAGWCGFCSTWHKLKDSAYVSHHLSSTTIR